ncbi:hypothetical protein ACFLUV_01000 [Elusimicrobiota bacterium]
MFKKIILFSLIMYSGTVCTGSAAISSGWKILSKPHSARFQSILAANPEKGDIAGFFYNPAVAVYNRDTCISCMSEAGPVDDIYAGILFSAPFKKSAFSTAFFYYDGGIVELSWVEAGEIISMKVRSQMDMLGILSYSYKLLRNTAFGASVKIAQSELAQMKRATAYAGDIGVSHRLKEKYNLTCALRNVGESTSFSDSKDKLPLSVYFAGGMNLSSKGYYITPVAAAAYRYYEEDVLPELGLEIGIPVCSFNFAYRFNCDEMKMHMGLKISSGDFSLGYALVPGIYFDTSHRLSIGYRFNRREQARVTPEKRKIVGNKNESYKKKAIVKTKKDTGKKAAADLKSMKEHLKKGDKFLKKNNFAMAIEEYNKVLELDNGDPDSIAYVNTARNKIKTTKELEKEAESDKKLKLKKKYFMKGHKLFRAEKYKASIETFEKVLELDPDHPQSLNYIKRAKQELHSK